MLPQVIYIKDAPASTDKNSIHINPQLPKAVLSKAREKDVTLSFGLFRERRELTKSYILRLQCENIF